MNTPPSSQRVPIAFLPTGVPGLDTVLGGGLPEFSFNLISGTPGAGKTTLAHQIMFANAGPDRPAIYFTVMGEPPIKMLRYQQQMAFFDIAKVGASVQFVDLSALLFEMGLDAVLARILGHVEAVAPSLVVVDSFQAIVRAVTSSAVQQSDLLSFTQRLAMHLTSWQATTFLVGEYHDHELQTNPVLTIADGIFTLSQQVERNSVVRKLQVVKSRGHAAIPGLHTLHITAAGLHVYPRMRSSRPADAPQPRAVSERGRSGVPGLDALLGGGIPAGDAVLISGPSGVGKSVLVAQIIAAGAAQGEPGVIAMFEEHQHDYIRRAASLGIDLAALERQGKLRLVSIRPLDLSPDEALATIHAAVQQIGAKRVAIDSISGFELALAPSFRMDFRESLYRLVGALTETGIVVLMTMEITQNTTDLRLSPYVISFLTDDILLLRYVEIAGRLHKSMVVVKMRNSAHSTDVYRYEITDQGVIVRETLHDHHASASRAGAAREDAYPGLVDTERLVLRAVLEQHGSTAADLAERTGVTESALSAALERLIALTYIRPSPDVLGPHYQPVVVQRTP